MARRSATFIAAIIVLLGGLVSACATASGGPQTWIDKPLDNTTSPLSPVAIIAHASASGGVARMEFTVDGETKWNVDTGGGRLVWQQVEWNPPGPGTYSVGARGIGADGVVGALATSLVTISGEQSLPVPLPFPATATGVTPELTVTPITPEAPAAPGVVAKINANCREGPGTGYDVYGSLAAGQPAEIKGRLSDNSWLLISLVGRSSYCWIAASVAEVSGDLWRVPLVAAGELPPVAGEEPPAAGEEPPPVDVIEPEPIEIDTPPSFAQIDAARDSCPANTVTVVGVVTDDKGIGSVIANWSLSSGESGQVGLNMGWLGYFASISPNTEGTMRIRMVATDTSGQSVSSDWLVLDFKQCID